MVVADVDSLKDPCDPYGNQKGITSSTSGCDGDEGEAGLRFCGALGSCTFGSCTFRCPQLQRQLHKLGGSLAGTCACRGEAQFLCGPVTTHCPCCANIRGRIWADCKAHQWWVSHRVAISMLKVQSSKVSKLNSLICFIIYLPNFSKMLFSLIFICFKIIVSMLLSSKETKTQPSMYNCDPGHRSKKPRNLL